MTQTEFKRVKSRLVELGNSFTHQHLLMRATKFFSILPSEIHMLFERYFYGFDQLLNLTSLEQQDASVVDNVSHPFGDVRYSYGLGLSVSKILDRIGSALVLEHGVQFYGTDCWIGQTEDLYLELWGDSQNVNKIILIKKIDTENYQDPVKIKKMISELGIFYRLSFNVFPFFETHPEFLEDGFKQTIISSVYYNKQGKKPG